MAKGKKVVLILLVLLILSAAGLATAILHNSARCTEPAFQASLAFGSSPRRFFEVKLEKSSGGLIPQFTYLITMQELPVSRITVSSFRCKKLSENRASEEEVDRFYKEQR